MGFPSNDIIDPYKWSALIHTSEHFSDEELKCHHCGLNRVRPELLQGLEALRALVSRPIYINDAYRCEEHNRKVGGVYGSYHVAGLAADIRVDGLAARTLYLRAVEAGKFHGFGRNDFSNYLHVDVRPTTGHIACWCYDMNGKEIPWYA